MDLKLVSCLCFCFTLTQNVKSQRINSWGSSQIGFGNSGFSGWNTNQGNNIFSSGQNSGFNSWDSGNSNDVPNLSSFGNVPSTWESNSFNNNNNRKFNSVNGNKRTEETWTSDSLNSNKRPKEDSSSSSFGFESSQNSNKKKNSAASSWNSNTFTSNERPKEQNSNNGKWQSSSVNTNNRPKEEKSFSSSNYPTSGTSWNTDSNKFTSSSQNDKNTWGSSQNSRPSDVSNTQNDRPGSWGSNSVSSSNNNKKQDGNNGDSFWDVEDNSVYSTFDTDNNKKPGYNSNSDMNSVSGSGSWGSSTQNNKKTEWNSSNNKKSNDKKSSSSNNSRPSGSGSWSSSSGSSSNNKPTESDFSNFGNEKPSKDTNRPSEQQNEKKSSNSDTSILDELDKNDWYFGSEDNYPEPPFKTNLNIDVSALWNFDKNKKPNQNSERNNNNNNNKRRRNRETGRLGMDTRDAVCECVNVNLCNEEDMIITKEDAANDGPLIEFKCKDYTDVCCRNPIIFEANRESDIFNEAEDYSLHCGQRKLHQKFYETSEDDTVQPGEFPWILRLQSFKNDVDCDGSLIHPRLALTAAHCVEGIEPEDLNVIAGVWNSNNEPSQSRNVLDIILHPNYNRKNPRNDIALLILEESFKLTDNVNTICLPVTNDKWDLNGCFVADWRSNQINGKVSETLEKGRIEFLPQYECQNILLVTEFWRKYILHDSFVCAIEKTEKPEKNLCLGEEGGPLICPSKKSPDTYLQIGIVSKSLNCDDVGGPGIITNVLQFLDWINKNTFELGLYDDIDVRNL